MGREFPKRDLLEDEESTLALQWIKEIGTAKSLDDLINPKSITGKDFSVYDELDLMMTAELKRFYDKYPDSKKKGSASKSTKLRRTTDFSEGVRSLIWSTKLQSVEPGNKKERSKNPYTERKTGEYFQRKSIVFCSRRHTCSFLHMHVTGDRETTWEEERLTWKTLKQFRGQSFD